MGASFSFDSRLVFLISGIHAARYLHNRLTNDVKSLSLASGRLAAPLSPQGRAEGFYSVTCIEKDSYLLIGDGGDRTASLAALMRYKVADRVDVLDLSESHTVAHLVRSEGSEHPALGALREVSPAPASGLFHDFRGAVYRNRRGTLGIDLVVPSAEKEELEKNLLNRGSQFLTPEEATRQRIIAGIPEYPMEISDEAIFLQPHLRNAVSFTKGCYVGQEVLERIDSHGKPPQTLVRLIITGTLSRDGTAVAVASKEGDSIGTILSSAYDSKENKTYLFAMVKTRALESGASVAVEGKDAVLL